MPTTANDLNISQAGYVVFDGTATFTGRTFQAGSGISITNASGVSGNTTISATPSVFGYKQIAFADSPYTVISTDEFISVNTSGGAITIRLPDSTTTSRRIIIKDRTGNAAANNLSITTVSGVVLIDTQATYTMASNFSSIQVLWNTASYEVF